MTKIVCSKCGLTGHSKNPAIRGVFPDNMNNPALTWANLLLRVERESAESVVIHVWCGENKSLAYALRNVAKIIEQLDEEGDADKAFCDHHWVMAEGETEWEVEF